MSDRNPSTIEKKRVSQRNCKSVKKRLKVSNDSKTKVENNHFERLPNEILLITCTLEIYFDVARLVEKSERLFMMNHYGKK